MKAILVESPGGIEALQYKDVPKPTLSTGQVLVKNDFAGLNFIDTYHRSGLYKRDYPIILGQEGGGTIDGLPEDPRDVEALSRAGLKVGSRVVYGAFGSYAEYTAVP